MEPSALPHPIRRRRPEGSTIDHWHAPDGWPIRRFDWPAVGQARGALLFLGGRGDIFEKHLEAFAHWQTRGWSVTAFDWRGHGGSGRLTADGTVGHLDSFTSLIDDLAAFWRDWTAPAPRVAMGHSMGGNVLAHALLSGRIMAAGAVLLSPMVRIRSPLGAGISERIARWQCRRADPGRAAWTAKAGDAARADAEAMLTADYGRLLDEHWWHERMPGLRLGPPSWGWLAAAFASGRALETLARTAPALDLSVLLLAADDDRLTDTRASRRFAQARGEIVLHRFPHGVGHELLREIDPVRDRALATIDRLLDDVAARYQ
ncbi:alpha/beta hydrolase [Sphingomonas sp. RP10(2022)]|uniref:Alpha/beta hydrolase n=1 Tax=Sphingomonas liriopis TaxID=2949094 RepID=A0A9X2KP47_9SPHN|nr:alpha/beta hydrolase [Sphingomonas liriopis]MCP3734319.1 alpha/beta hydrolase [Sphingomonas liriopis]